MLLLHNVQLDMPVAHRWSVCDMQLVAGDALHILGVNGVGKSTFLRCLAGLLPVAGSVTFVESGLCCADESWPTMVGFMPRRFPVFSATVALVLRTWYGVFVGGSCSEERLGVCLEELALDGNLPMHYLSTGQLQRLMLAPLLLANKKVWLLDEPFVSLDNYWSGKVGCWLQDYRNEGGVVVMTGHGVHKSFVDSEDKCFVLERMHGR